MAVLASLATAVLIGCDVEEPAAAISDPLASNTSIGADQRVSATGIAVDRSRARYESEMVAVDEMRGVRLGSFDVSPPADADRPALPAERPPVPEPISKDVPPPPNVFSWLLRQFLSGTE